MIKIYYPCDEDHPCDHECRDSAPVDAHVLVQHEYGEEEGEDRRAEKYCRGRTLQGKAGLRRNPPFIQMPPF